MIEIINDDQIKCKIIDLELVKCSDFRTISFQIKSNASFILVQNDSKFSVFFSDRTKMGENSALLIAIGTNLYETMDRAMNASLTSSKLPNNQFAPLFHGLGFVTSAFCKESICHKKIIDAVTTLTKSGCPIKFVVLEDGWQDCENGVLKSFDADSKRFPQGLKQFIIELHDLGIDHVAVSHGMIGLHEDLATKYEIDADLLQNYFLGKNLGKAFEFFNDYYGYLKAQGIAFVSLEVKESPYDLDISQYYKNLQAAIHAAASVHFNSFLFKIIEDTNSRTLMQSVRDCLFNAFWNRHFMLPNFGSWKTNDEHGEILAVLHALSGSINFICDDEGTYNHNLVKKICLPSGKILKADHVLTLCKDSVFVDPIKEKNIYKAFTYKAEVAVLAAFNLKEDPCTLHGLIAASDVPGFERGRFALFSHQKGFVGCFLANEQVEITLKSNQVDVFTFAPVKNGIAVLGCYHFFLLRGAITEVNIEEDSIHITSLVASPIIIYCERDVLEVRRNGAPIRWDYDEKRNILCIDSRQNHLDEHSVYTVTF